MSLSSKNTPRHFLSLRIGHIFQTTCSTRKTRVNLIKRKQIASGQRTTAKTGWDSCLHWWHSPLFSWTVQTFRYHKTDVTAIDTQSPSQNTVVNVDFPLFVSSLVYRDSIWASQWRFHVMLTCRAKSGANMLHLVWCWRTSHTGLCLSLVPTF